MVEDPVILVRKNNQSASNTTPGDADALAWTYREMRQMLTAATRGKHQYSLFLAGDNPYSHESGVAAWTTFPQNSTG